MKKTPDPLVKAAEAMPAKKRRRARNRHHQGSSHKWTHRDIVELTQRVKADHLAKS